MRKSYEMDMTRGPLLRSILIFTLPLLLSGVLQLLFNATDIVVVGQFAGANAMASVGSTTSLFNLLINAFIGISVGANVLVARYCGEKNYDGVQQTVQTSLLTGLVGGVILVVLGIVLARPMLTLMKTPDEVIEGAVLYMRVYFIGMPATMIYNFGAAVLRAVGDTRRPLYFLMAAGVMNVLGDLLFVCVLGMGVAGVALATVLSQCVSATLTVLCLTGSDGMCHLDIRRLRFYPERFAQIMKIGLPAGMQSVIFNISNVLIQSSINSFGAVAVAGNTAAANVEGFVYISMNSLYQTTLSFTSQNLGAKQYRRVDGILVRCMILVILIGVVLGQGAYRLGDPLLHIYSQDPEVIAYGIQRFSVVSLTYFLCGMMDVGSGVVRGLGYSIMPMLVSMVGACVFCAVRTHLVGKTKFFDRICTLFLSYEMLIDQLCVEHIAVGIAPAVVALDGDRVVIGDGRTARLLLCELFGQLERIFPAVFGDIINKAAAVVVGLDDGVEVAALALRAVQQMCKIAASLPDGGLLLERIRGQLERAGGLHEVVELAARLDLHDGEQDVGILRNTVLLGVVRHHVAVGHDGVRDQAVGDVGLERAVVGGSARPGRTARGGWLMHERRDERDENGRDEQHEQLTAACSALAALALARSRAGTRLDMRGFGRAAQGRTMSVISMLFS